MDTKTLAGHLLTAVCATIAVAHLYLALVPAVSELERNAWHFAGFAFLAALLTPMTKGAERGPVAQRLDMVFGALVALSAVHLSLAENAIYDRGVKLAPLDWTAAILCILGAIELTRRLTGWIIPVLIILSISYVAVWGSWVGGVFSFSGLSWETVIFRSIYGDDAMFGSIARISSTYVFLFIIFGAFLLRSGAGDFVIGTGPAPLPDAGWAGRALLR